MKQKILHIICIAIGIVFIASGLGKIVNTAAFGSLIAQYGLGWLQLLAPLIVLLEIAVGTCLILRIQPKAMSLLSVGLLLLFTTAFTYGHFKNGITDCGCFGVLKTGENSVALVYVRNILLVGLSLLAGLYSPACQEKISEAKKVILLGTLLPLIFVAGLTYQIPTVFRPKKAHAFLNKNIKETFLHDYIQTSPDSSYLLFFYSYSCPHCWNSVENFKHFKRGTEVGSVASFVLINADSSKNVEHRNEFVKYFGNFGAQEVVNDIVLQSFVKAVPTTFYVKNDTIKNVIEGALPSPLTFSYMQNHK